MMAGVHSPSDIPSGQGEEIEAVRECVFMFGGNVDVLRSIDLSQASEVMARQGALTAEPTLRYTHSHTHTFTSHNSLRFVTDGQH